MNTSLNETRLQRQEAPLQVAPVMRELSKERQLQWVERLFLKMQAFYGNRFNDLWHGIPAEEIKQVWADALGGFSSEQIAEGLRVCLGEKYPPNLPEFIAYCRIKPLADTRRLEQKPASKERALEILARCKSSLSRKDLASGERLDA